MTTNRTKVFSAAALAASAALTMAGSTHADEGAPAPPPAASPPAAAPAVVDPANTPATAQIICGVPRKYRPLLRLERFGVKPGGLEMDASFHLGIRAEGTSTFPVDRDLNGFQPGVVLAPLVRAGLRLDTGAALGSVILHAEYEHDLPTGLWTSDKPIAGSEMPGSTPIEQQLRKLDARISIGPYLHVGGGFMTNHFGLGLLANDGVQTNWTPGSARFADNRGGDRVLRGYIGTGPLTDAGLTATFAVDKVQGDDVLLPGDEAFQVIGTASLGAGKAWGTGLFVVYRRQDNAGGTRTNATVVDLTARYAGVLPWISYSLEGEIAFVGGDTTLGPTPEFPRHKLRQIGGAARLSVRRNHVGGVVDFLFASGDASPDDGEQTAFKADPNFETGLLLYRQVLAAQTGRGSITAANPDLVGVPSPGLERVPTRGSPTNTVALFPRIYVRPVAGAEIYGGPLLAWGASRLADPLNTRLGGGVPHNALDGKSGDFMGVELDVGARYRLLFGGTELVVGVEGAVLLPGDAFVDPQGNTMAPVLGGRALFNYRL